MDINKVIEALKKGNTIKTKEGVLFRLDEHGNIVNEKGEKVALGISLRQVVRHIDDFKELLDIDCEVIYPQVLDGALHRDVRKVVPQRIKKQ